VVQDAIEHADVPFARVVEAARVPRSTAHTPVYQTMMTLQGALYGTRKGDAAMSLAGLEVADWAVRCHARPRPAAAAWSLRGAAVASEHASVTASPGSPRE